MPTNTKPQFKYDKGSRKWRDQYGGFITKAQMKQAIAIFESEPKDGKYGYNVNFNRHPDSDIWASIERIVGMGERGVDISGDPALQAAGNKFNSLLAFLDHDNMVGANPYQHQVRNNGQWELAADKTVAQQDPPQPIPTGIRSAMTLSEYYCNTQGDVYQHIEAPIDLSITELNITVPKDKGLEKMLRDLYGPEQLNMRYILEQNMLISSVFGSAYPMEVPDDRDNPTVIQQIIPLPPKYMWVGYHMVNGMLAPEGSPSPYAMRPWDGSPNWTKELAQKMFMPQTYNAYASGMNEQIVQGWGLPVDPKYLHPVRAKAFHWIRYPQPPISRAFRSLSTRSIYQEMRRSTLEGYKNQLWLFLLGSDKIPPSPNEMAQLKSAVDGMSGQRTGNLVWRNGLQVDIKAPAALNNALGSEAAQVLSLEVFRDLGSNARLTTGNKISMPGSGAGDTGIEIDMSVWLRRLEHIRANNMEWEFMFRMRQADRWDAGLGTKARDALRTAKVSFSKSLLEIAEAIKQEVIPLYSVGLTSPQTALARSGGDYETELNNKKAFEPNRENFTPPPTYNQMTTSADGKTSQSASTAPKGRTPDVLNPNKLKADWNESKSRKLYLAAVAALLTELWDTEDVDAFIQSLKDTNVHWLDQIGTESYKDMGGVGSPNLELLRIASDFVNSYADNFGNDLKKFLADGVPIATDPIQRRTMQYPQEGFKAAVVNMQNQALAERGASHWRRVLHPELSKSGPCPACMADSNIVHAMAEPFEVMHPGDVCGTQDINLQYFTSGIPSIEVPTPNAGNELAQEMFLNKKAGKTRRKRL